MMWHHLFNEEAAGLKIGILQGLTLALMLVDMGSPFKALTTALADEDHASMDCVDMVGQRSLAAERLATLITAMRASPWTLRLVLSQQRPTHEWHVAHVTLVCLTPK